jgi:hypothetical protein
LRRFSELTAEDLAKKPPFAGGFWKFETETSHSGGRIRTRDLLELGVVIDSSVRPAGSAVQPAMGDLVDGGA